MKKSSFFVIISHIFVFLMAFSCPVYSQSHNWNSPSEVVKKIKKKFYEIKSYTSDFKIQTVTGKSVINMKGKCTYKAPGKIRYDFSEPDGDAIVSDGKILWIYIKKIGAAGKQDLEINKINSSNEPIFQPNSQPGLNRLFRKYHYKFDSINQPRYSNSDSRSYFVLSLEQREKIGGFENMTLFIDSETFLIKRAIASDSRGKQTTIEFQNFVENPDIEDGFFTYHVSGNARIINNPLVSGITENNQ